MLDLSRPLEPVDGLVLYADHERSDLVYYLPDEIGLAEGELGLQVFYPDEAQTGSPDDLGDAVGAILSVGTRCLLSEQRAEHARSVLSSRLGHPVSLTVPPWEDGAVELLLLDSQGSAEDPDAMVREVVGSKRPSLQDGRLSGLFHARLDRRGTALVSAALLGQTGSVAGVLYDLTFAALRPSVDLRMSANLDRCAEFFRASAGVQVYYVGADISVGFGTLREQGVIDVEVISQATDPEAERLVNEAVRDFYDVLMRELFRPIVSPAELIGSVPVGSVQTAPVKFSFSYTRSEQERVVSVDYRKRSATRRTHNPSAHLRELAALTDPASVIQRVPLSAAWREVGVQIAAPQAFDEAKLLGMEVVLWRGSAGVLAADAARENGLRMPVEALPLADLAFARDDAEPRQLAWVNQPSEPPFYRWQARLSYAPESGVDSPAELWTEPQVSSSSDLDLFPPILVPRREVTLLLGVGHDESLQSVDAAVVARDPLSGKELASKQLVVRPSAPEARWAVRRGEGQPVSMEAALTYRYAGGRSVTLPSRVLLDPELPANTPFASTVELTPLLTGPTDGLLEVVFTADYTDQETGYQHHALTRLRPPNFEATAVRVPVLRAGHQVHWQASALHTDGRTRQLSSGDSAGGVLVVEVSDRLRLTVEWLGGPLADLGLRWAKVLLRTRANDGSVADSQTVEWRETLDARTVLLSAEGTPEYSVQRRFTSGTTESTPWQRIEGDLIAVS